MPAPDLESFKVANGELSSSTKFNNLVQAIEDEFGDIDADQIPGFPNDVAAFLRGDGAWSGALSTYSPSWSSSGTAPALGNGTLSGRFLQIGKLVKVSIALTAGSTTTFGTGDWRFTLPSVAGHATVESNGIARYFDSSAAAIYLGLARWNGSLLQCRTSASPTVLVDNANPFAWANADSLFIDLLYEAA